MDSLFFFLSDVVINLKWSHLWTYIYPCMPDNAAEHRTYLVSFSVTLSYVFNSFPFLKPFSFSFSRQRNLRISMAGIIISPEENVTLTCTAENQLERTVNSLNVSASEYFLSGIKKSKKIWSYSSLV